MEMVPTQEPVTTARADLVAILEELRGVLVRIDAGRSPALRRLRALAKRLEECIETVEGLPLPDESE